MIKEKKKGKQWVNVSFRGKGTRCSQEGTHAPGDSKHKPHVHSLGHEGAGLSYIEEAIKAKPVFQELSSGP